MTPTGSPASSRLTRTPTATVFTPHPATSPDELMDQAIRWSVRLESGQATPADHDALERWRRQSPGHERAWREVQGFAQELAAIPPNGKRLLQDSLATSEQMRARQRKRGSLKLLGIGVVGLLGGGAGLQALRLSHSVQVATRIGQRRSLVLPDGTALHVNTGSSVQVAFGPLRRILHLQDGELLVETGADPASLARPRGFWVYTRHARLHAVGTRFSVRVAGAGTRLHVSEGQVDVHTTGFGPHPARAGDTVQIDAGPEQPLRKTADQGLDQEAWVDGHLVVRRMPLPQFLAELARYQDGARLQADARASALKVSGVFRLDGPDPVGRALATLELGLPVRVRRDAAGQVVVLGR